jgi:3',5'-cyclic AMP phosphodiesterase CpdA
MKILHISDFHLSPGDDSNLLREGYVEEFVGSLCNSLREELPIDLLVVTGDLVSSGKIQESGSCKEHY